MLIARRPALGYRANVWNIGAEGQLTLGAICRRRRGAASADAIARRAGCCRLMIVAGALGGMAWAAIPAFLRTRFNANEILTSA